MTQTTTRTTVECLRALPIQPLDEVWQLGFVSTMHVPSDGATPVAHRSAVCVGPGGNMTRTRLHPLPKLPDDVLLQAVRAHALDAHAPDAEPLGYLPSRLVVTTTDAVPSRAVALLEKHLRSRGVTIERSSVHSELDAVRSRIAHQAQRQESAARGGVSIDASDGADSEHGVLMFAEAACSLTDAARRSAHRPRVWRIERPDAPIDSVGEYAICLPGTHGVILMTSESSVVLGMITASIRRPVDADRMDFIFEQNLQLGMPMWIVDMVAIGERPASESALWRQRKLPTTAARGAPDPRVLPEDGDWTMPTSSELEQLEALLRALATAHRDKAVQNHWSGTITTSRHTSAMTVTFENDGAEASEMLE